MLPQFRKYIVRNTTGASGVLTFDSGGRINLKEAMWIVDPATGLITYDTATTPDDDLGFIAGGTLANDTEIIGDIEISNVTAKNLGSQVQLEITHDAGTLASGTFELYVAQGDASGELDTDATGYIDTIDTPPLYVGTLRWPLAATDGQVIRSKVFSVGN